MKPRRTPPGRKSGGGTLLGLFVGLVIGVLAVAGVVWYINKAPLPFTTTGQQPKLPPPVGSKPATPEVPPVASAPVTLPGKPGDAVPDKPRFDFYKILPGKAEAIPDPKPEEPRQAETRISTPGKATETKPIESRPPETRAPEGKTPEGKAAESRTASGKATEAKAAEVAKPAESTRPKNDRENALREPIYLQAGSFQNASDADNQKARLALIGAEARIQQVMLQDKVWYRVRLGPYHRMDEVNNLRADLARQGIEANVVKKD
ncbi:SPOR domain-containing protein [Accumulibacter sp.]|uniref:SPOR domain-containing protein n=1 Tax=Accumulibacter sp. TaxID=2053492 RepID=UPI0025D52987|nr:SPOR domain-containing protein [Accumulibacter sp.]MCM8595202.1 SPOR domain-containing protein [Accumulibacter sp.]MDS4049348.1 SPOR domain-containing protein [Accumulibacter sp.]